MTPDILCIGSVLWDIIGRSPTSMRLGSDVPGRITRLPGGVAVGLVFTLCWRNNNGVPGLLLILPVITTAFTRQLQAGRCFFEPLIHCCGVNGAVDGGATLVGRDRPSFAEAMEGARARPLHPRGWDANEFAPASTPATAGKSATAQRSVPTVDEVGRSLTAADFASASPLPTTDHRPPTTDH